MNYQCFEINDCIRNSSMVCTKNTNYYKAWASRLERGSIVGAGITPGSCPIRSRSGRGCYRPMSASLPSSLLRLVSLVLATGGSVTLRDGKQTSFGVEAQGETQWLLRGDGDFRRFVGCECAPTRLANSQRVGVGRLGGVSASFALDLNCNLRLNSIEMVYK